MKRTEFIQRVVVRLLLCLPAMLILATPAPAQDLGAPTATTGPRFTDVSSVVELSDGSVLLADRGESSVWHYQWAGSSQQPVMRSGPGPGEFRMVGRIIPMSGDSWLFLDGYHSRWSILDGTEFVESFSESRPINRLLNLQVTGATDSLVLGWPPSADPRADSVGLLLADWRTGEHREIARLRTPSSDARTTIPASGDRPMWLLRSNPLASIDLAVMATDGWVAVVRTDPYHVEWRRPDGSWIIGDPLPFESRPVDRAERCFAVERALPHECEDVELPGWPEVVPPIIGRDGMPRPRAPMLFPTPDGHALIVRAPTAATGVDTTRHDVVDRTGALVSTLTLSGGRRIVGFGAESVYVISMNELGLQTIDRHAWPPGHDVP